ncbi:MobP2 family relaxase [Lactobacillus bombicola]|uniref:Relaxase n=1 Tax=Lactobacillus bombicola TaxID=1505723 RepID=A0A396SZ63_9LACO|nr:MobP2 family relaxase [Lactobacillus bombicola]RHW55061.1 hypothetical protein DS835_01420 [Lactobacillus bombicola]
MSKAPSIVLTSEFVYARATNQSQTRANDYGGYSVDYMARKEALEKLSYLTPEEETEYLQRKELLHNLSEPDLEIVSKHYSSINDNSKLAHASITELNKENFIELNAQDYSKYIGYMMRKQALAEKQNSEGLSKKEQAELERVTQGAAKYDAPNVGKNKILQGYFSSEQDTIKLSDLGHIREKMRSAQANNSILWQDVISFDNDYLRKMGVFDPTTGYLDESGIRKASKKMMETLTEKEKLNNPFWTAAIHRNTDNIHIHFGIVEESNSRPLKKWKDENGVTHIEPKGWRQLKTIEAMKHAFASEMFDMSELLRDMNLRRNKITKGMTTAFSKSIKEPSFQRELNDFIQKLPEDRKKWRWANLNNNQRRSLNRLVDLVMTDDTNYQKWNKLFSHYREHYREMYGQAKNDRINDSTAKWTDFKKRAGNSLLNEIKKIDQEVNHFPEQNSDHKTETDETRFNQKSTNSNYDSTQKPHSNNFARSKIHDNTDQQIKELKYLKHKKGLEKGLKKAIKPILTEKASNIAYNRMKQQCEKNLTTFEKQRALSVYEQTQEEISYEQERR